MNLTGRIAARLETAAAALTLLGSKSAAYFERASRNERIVVDFYNMIFRDLRPADAFARYTSAEYTQHNPNVPDGQQGAIDYFVPLIKANPDTIVAIKRVVAAGDLVVLHVHLRRSESDRGIAVIDIFRLERGKIVEHWDVIQIIPETSANDNTMF